MWMERLRDWPRAAVLGAALAVLTGCSEDLVGGAACPSLCPGTNVVVRDTVLEAVVFDTVVSGSQSLGSEDELVLVSRGDTLDTRVVFRFDSLPTRITRNGGDSAITAVDSAYLLLRLTRANSRVSAPVRIDLYDVDTSATDTSTRALLPLFRDDRLLGGSTLDTNQVRDSMRVYFRNDRLLSRITGSGRLRVGLRLTSARAATLSLGSLNASRAVELKFDPVPSDTAIREISVLLRSKTPTDNALLQSDLQDYMVVAQSPPQPGADILSVGGLPSRRSFLRISVPSRILDSATVLRATLLLTQRPNRTVDPRDSVLILPQVVTAGEEVTDYARVVQLLNLAPVDTVRVAPGDSGVRQIEVAAALRQWAVPTNPFRQQRALVFRSNAEGVSGFDAHFYSLRAAPALRPKLRVSYSLRTSFGIP